MLYLCFWCVHVSMDTRSRLNQYFKAVPFQFGNGSLNVCSVQNQGTTVVLTPTLATHLPTRTPMKPLASKLSIGYLHKMAMVVVNSDPGQCVSYLGEIKSGIHQSKLVIST